MPVGRRSFTRAEVEALRRLIREKQTADASRQKTLRSRMRRMDFYISDFAADSGGFVVADLDDLISRGVITVTDDDIPSLLAAATKTADEEVSAVRAASPGS